MEWKETWGSLNHSTVSTPPHVGHRLKLTVSLCKHRNIWVFQTVFHLNWSWKEHQIRAISIKHQVTCWNVTKSNVSCGLLKDTEAWEVFSGPGSKDYWCYTRGLLQDMRKTSCKETRQDQSLGNADTMKTNPHPDSYIQADPLLRGIWQNII